MLFQVFHICVMVKQHLEDCEWSGVESGNTVVCLWSFSLFWCGIEVWFVFSLSVAVGADTAMCVYFSFFEWSPLDCSHQPSWVGRMHLPVAIGARGCGP